MEPQAPTRLFIALYLDEDVESLVARLIRARGFEAIATEEVGRKGAKDPEQMDYAVAGGYAIVTHNRRDFERLAREYGDADRSHGGIIIARRRSPYELAGRLLDLLDQVTADEMADQLLYI
jgi:hypothetical protein